MESFWAKHRSQTASEGCPKEQPKISFDTKHIFDCFWGSPVDAIYLVFMAPTGLFLQTSGLIFDANIGASWQQAAATRPTWPGFSGLDRFSMPFPFPQPFSRSSPGTLSICPRPPHILPAFSACLDERMQRGSPNACKIGALWAVTKW